MNSTLCGGGLNYALLRPMGIVKFQQQVTTANLNNKRHHFFLTTLYNVIQDYVTTYKGYTTLYDTI